MAEENGGKIQLNPGFQNLLPAVIEVLESRGVKEAWVFGSACRDDFSEASDIDLLVDLKEPDPIRYADSWWALLFELEDRTGRSVDLVSPESLTNKYFKNEVLATAARLL